MPEMLERLRQRAEGGEPSAQYRLAQALYGADRHDEALTALGSAARGGHLGAVTELGSRLATGAGAPLAPADGDELLRFAADAGDATAARHLAILAGAGLEGPPDWVGALAWTARAAALGDTNARADLCALTGEHARTSEDWATLAQRVEVARWTRVADSQPLSREPFIVTLPAIAPPALCCDLIAAGQPSLARAAVTDAQTGKLLHTAARTNRFAQVKLFDCGLPLLLLRARLAAAAGQPCSHCEIMNLLSYEPGQAFDLHPDYLDPDEAGFADELARDGQRIATILVYLNDDYAGGETHFPAPGIRFRGAIGDGLMFRNVDAAGRVDRATLHAGLPPTAGRKWVLSQWVRDRPQRQI